VDALPGYDASHTGRIESIGQAFGDIHPHRQEHA
jgi:hypothetical protein